MSIEIIDSSVPPMVIDGKYVIRYEYVSADQIVVWYNSFYGTVVGTLRFAIGSISSREPVTTISIYGQIGDEQVLAARYTSNV